MLSLKYKLIRRVLKEIPNDLIKNIGEYINLKLYDVSSYAYDNNISDDTFTQFCEIEYDKFKDFLEEKNCKMEYKGHTSSFRVNNSYELFDYCNNYPDDIFNKKITLIEEFMYKEYNLYIARQTYNVLCGEKIITSLSNVDKEVREYFDGCICDVEILEIIVKDFKDYMIDTLKEINAVYNYVDNFKKNQIEIFKEFLENNY